MLLFGSQRQFISLPMIEGGLTAIAFAAAFAWPRLGFGWYSSIERGFTKLARKRRSAVAAVGLATLLLRVAILPWSPIPLPFLPADFSLLLAADTFAHGRLTNPTPAMWVHFETVHVDMNPAYMSMYFPAPGLLFAAGKVLFGHPWFGLLIASALMCAAICWMLQAWLPPGWALLGGIVAMLRLGLFSYWINTYTGGGLILALGGALVLGALPRLMKTARFRYGVLMATGIALLALTRPYEGLLLCLPVSAALGRWAFFGENRPPTRVLIRRAAFPLALIVGAVAWLGYYNDRAFGSPLTMPYTVNRAAYAMAPYFAWQPQRPEPAYRHEEMRRFYYENELKTFAKIHSNYVLQTLTKPLEAFIFFAGLALFIPLIMLRRAILDRRIRFLVLCLAVLMAGLAIENFLLAHYMAPFTVVFYAIGLQAMRHLRVWRPGGKSIGATMVRLSVSLCFVMAGLRLFAAPLHLEASEWPVSNWTWMWYGPGAAFGTERAQIQSNLEQQPGKQLVILRYSPKRDPLDLWVYNEADIDASKVVWAREMDAADDRELLEYYRDRTAWLVQMDTVPATVSSYPSLAP
jgi:hypothetical protein